jgi:hypothetical protein
MTRFNQTPSEQHPQLLWHSITMRPTASFTIVFASLAFAAPHKAEQLSSIESLPDSVEVHAVRGAPVKAPLLPSTSTAPSVTTALAATTSTKTTSESTTSASSSSSGAPSPPAESSPADPVDTLWPTDSSSSEDVSHIDIWSNSSDHAGDLGNEVSTPDTDDLNRWKNRCGENYYRCQDVRTIFWYLTFPRHETDLPV